VASNPLTDVIPTKARKYVYAGAFLVATGFSVYQATEGNWAEFVASLTAALVPATAYSNTDVE